VELISVRLSVAFRYFLGMQRDIRELTAEYYRKPCQNADAYFSNIYGITARIINPNNGIN
jgi:hypothetical protein